MLGDRQLQGSFTLPLFKHFFFKPTTRKNHTKSLFGGFQSDENKINTKQMLLHTRREKPHARRKRFLRTQPEENHTKSPYPCLYLCPCPSLCPCSFVVLSFVVFSGRTSPCSSRTEEGWRGPLSPISLGSLCEDWNRKNAKRILPGSSYLSSRGVRYISWSPHSDF